MGKTGALFKGQSYDQLHKSYKELESLYSDSVFPASSSSIGSIQNLPANIEWKRPGNICESPRLIVTDKSTAPVVQGKFSSNYFVSACSILGGISELLHQVIPYYWKQEWDSENKDNYKGIFHFCFWRFGQWVDVVVDDLLPTVNNELIFTKSRISNEFWTPLLEKAYAKLHGSYEALQGGHIADALVDFTGGVSEVIDLKNEDFSADIEKLASLFATLLRDYTNHAVMCCTITDSSATTNIEGRESRNELGLYQGHAYAITCVKKIHLGETTLRTLFKGREKCLMVRLQDPRGEGAKTPVHSASVDGKVHPTANYAYTTRQLTRLLSKSVEWSHVKESEMHRMGLVFDNEGEFWMPMEDFVCNFSELVICRQYETSVFTVSRPWYVGSAVGQWTTGARGTSSDRSGGGTEYPDTYLRNPQYVFDVNNNEEEIAVQMLQWDPEAVVHHIAMQKHLISFMIIKVEENRKYRLHRQWEYNPTVVRLDHARKREIVYRGHLNKGRYVLIPTATKPGEVGHFLVRVFLPNAFSFKPLDQEVPRYHWYSWCWCFKVPTWFTVIHVKSGENLMKVNRFGTCDPYCIVQCEGKSFRTSIAKNTTNPTWNCAFLFLRRDIDKPIEIQVYSHNAVMRDEFLGQAQLPALVNQHPSLLHVELKQRKSDELMEGTILLDVLTDDYMMAI